MRPATYVPETKRIDDLLPRDAEAGGSSSPSWWTSTAAPPGIVTVEDIVEEIVGEIHDEHDRTPATVERLPDGSYLRGRAHGHRRAERGARLGACRKEDYETVAGLVLATLHRIPRPGEEVHDRPATTLTVLEADERRILTVKIRAPRPAPRPGRAARPKPPHSSHKEDDSAWPAGW